jgi:hypothetical protein
MQALRIALIVASVFTAVGCRNPSVAYEADITSEILVEFHDNDDQPELDLARFNRIAAAFGGAQITDTTDE